MSKISVSKRGQTSPLYAIVCYLIFVMFDIGNMFYDNVSDFVRRVEPRQFYGELRYMKSVLLLLLLLLLCNIPLTWTKLSQSSDRYTLSLVQVRGILHRVARGLPSVMTAAVNQMCFGGGGGIRRWIRLP